MMLEQCQPLSGMKPHLDDGGDGQEHVVGDDQADSEAGVACKGSMDGALVKHTARDAVRCRRLHRADHVRGGDVLHVLEVCILHMAHNHIVEHWSTEWSPFPICTDMMYCEG